MLSAIGIPVSMAGRCTALEIPVWTCRSPAEATHRHSTFPGTSLAPLSIVPSPDERSAPAGLFQRRRPMPRGDKSAYTDKQKRQAEHIAESYEDRGTPADEAKARAWATVNAMTGGGKKSGSGRGKKVNKAPAEKGGRKGGAATAARPAAARSASARKAARTRASQTARSRKRTHS